MVTIAFCGTITSCASAKQMYSAQNFCSNHRALLYGYYKNHPVIGRESPSVKNGVYFTVNPNSEAVVVDDASRTLQQAAKGMLRQVGRRFGKAPTVSTKKTLELVDKYTDQLMPYDLEKTEKLSAPHYNDNGLINLSEYVENKAGVCRHQCLLAAFLLETLVDKGVLVGRSGVERNHDIDAHGAHAWAIFEQPNGTVYVVDPAQGFVGTKEQARAKGLWKYDLPVEQ